MRSKVTSVTGIVCGVSERTKIILLQVIFPELGGGNVHRNANAASVTGFLNGLDYEVKCIGVDQDVWGKATFITDIGGVLAELLLGQGLM